MDIFTKIYFTCKISSLFIQIGSAEKVSIFTKIYFTCKISSLFVQIGSAEKVSILQQTQKIVFLHLNALYC